MLATFLSENRYNDLLMKKLAFILLLLSGSVTIHAQAPEGKASYYAKKFEGKKTASGEKFSNKKLTAAHKTLPFGTQVKITNLENNRCVIVTINDRLPKKSKRIIDVTQHAADELGFNKSGTATVTLEVLPQ
jgi:rare lipoprotein A